MRRLIDMSVFAQSLQHSPDFFRFEERGFVEESIVLDVDCRQRALDPGEHDALGFVAEALPARVAQGFAICLRQIARDIDQVFALIMIVGQRRVIAQLLQVTQLQALAQDDHLVAGVVVIIFTLDFVTGRFQQTRHRIANYCAACMTNGDGATGVGADELYLSFLSISDIDSKVLLTFVNNTRNYSVACAFKKVLRNIESSEIRCRRN